MRRHRVGRFLTAALVAATAVTVVATPAHARRKAPDVCKVVTDFDIEQITGSVDVVEISNEPLNNGRSGTCVYDLSGGIISGSDPSAAQISVFFSRVVKGRGYIAGTGAGITKLKLFPDGPGDQAIIGYEDGTWVLVAQDGRKTAMVITQPTSPTDLTKAELKRWTIKVVEDAFA